MKGTYPNPQHAKMSICLHGIPLILCDEEGIALLVTDFATVDIGSLKVAPVIEITTVVVIVWTGTR